MNKPIHPAVAEHVMEENEKLRGLLEAALYYIPSNKTELRALIDAALSQQAEPTDTFTAVDMATAAAQGFRDGQAAVEPPAPAQDEREARALFEQMGLIADDEQCIQMLAAALATRPAQTEQQPVSWQFYQDGKWWNGDDRIKDHRKNTEAAGIPVRDLYAAPIAQTEQQPVEQWQVRYLPGQKVEERWWQDSTAERAAWCAEANAEQLAKGLPDVWEIRKFYAAPIAQAAPQPEQSGLVEALEHARTFIRNGVDLGFVTMPDPETPDPAHDTLPMIERALAGYRAALSAQGESHE